MDPRDGEWHNAEGGRQWRIVSFNEKTYKEWFDGKESRFTNVEQSSARKSSIPRHVPTSNDQVLGQRELSPSTTNRHARPTEGDTGERLFKDLPRDSGTVKAPIATSRSRKDSTSTQGTKSGSNFALSSKPELPLDAEDSPASRHNIKPITLAQAPQTGTPQTFYSQNLPLRTTPYDAVRISQVGIPTNRHGQPQSGVARTSTATLLSEPLLSFSLIDPGDFQSCKDYIKKNREVLDKNKNPLLLEAIQAQKDGRTQYVRACIQRAIIIQECADFSIKGVWEYLDDLINEEGEASNDFYDRFDTALANIVERAGRGRRPTNPLPVPAPTIAQPTLPSVPESQIEFKGTRGEEEKLDKRYRKRGDPADFFVVGRVFALLWHENAGDSKKSKLGKPDFTSKGRYHENIFSHIRRMVVVRQRYGYCWCIPINSYGGNGVASKNMSKEEVESHTIIHMSTAKAARLKAEAAMIKEPIAVDMAPKQTLDQMSRLNFAKIHTVEHNVKVMEVGMVCRANMPRLEGYWRNEMIGN